MISKKFLIILLYLIPIFSFAQIKILFDATKAQTAGNADWQIDADLYNVSYGSGNPSTNGSGTEANPQRFPTPSQSTIDSLTPESYWKGGLSSWGIECVKRGYQVETLPIGGIITYGNTSNAQDLSNYNVFIIDEPNILFTNNERDAIFQFVQNGGGLMIISDHDQSDRNFDGYDSPTIWNTMMGVGNPFGFYFNFEDFSQSTTNIPNLPTDSLLNGIYGNVNKVQFNGGTSMTLTPTTNSSIKGIVYKTGSTFGNSNVMVAYSRYGLGKVVAIGDSSPEDDGTGDVNDVLYDGWLGNATGNHRKLIMNATVWLASKALTVDLSKTNCTCHGQNNGTAKVVPKGGNGIYTYKWSNGKTTSSIANLSPGIYTVTVSSGSNIITSVTITEPSELTVTEQIQNISCANSMGQIEVFVSGGTPNYSYKWSNNLSNNKLTTTIGGNYSLTITDFNGCTFNKNFTIIVDTIKPNGEILGDSIITCEKTQLTLTGNATISNVSYHWTGSGIDLFQKNIIVQKDGNYLLQIKNNTNDCYKDLNINVKKDTVIPKLSIEGDTIITCYKSEAVLHGISVVNGAIYEWNWKGVVNNGKDITLVDSGLIHLKVQNPKNGCKKEMQKLILKDTAIPNLTIEGDSIITCYKPEAVLQGISDVNGVIYEWNWKGILSSGKDITLTDSGLIHLKVQNPKNGCKKEIQKLILKDTAIPNFTIEGDSIITCYKSDAVLHGISDVNGVIYEWNWKGVLSSGKDITLVDSGLIHLKVQNPKNGCKKEIQKLILKDTAIPSLSIEGDSIITCYKPEAVLHGISDINGAIYEWNWKGIVSNGKDITLTDSGLIQLKVQNPKNGCMKEIQKLILKDTAIPLLSIDGDSIITCYKPEAVLHGISDVNGAIYEWNWKGILSSGKDITLTDSGLIHLKVQNPKNGCKKEIIKQIFSNKKVPEKGILGADTITCNRSEVFIEAKAKNKTYEWYYLDSLVSKQINFAVKKAGNYYLKVTDTLNGCFLLDSITIFKNDEHPMISSVEIKSDTNNTSKGSLSVFIEGGKLPYIFQWKDSSGKLISSSQNLTNVTFGSYEIIVTDNNGCSTSKIFNISNFITKNEELKVLNIKLFPNPTNGLLNIEYDKDLGSVDFLIYNENGKFIKNLPLNNNNQIELNECFSGIYFIKIINKESIQWEKIIVLR